MFCPSGDFTPDSNSVAKNDFKIKKQVTATLFLTLWTQEEIVIKDQEQERSGGIECWQDGVFIVEFVQGMFFNANLFPFRSIPLPCSIVMRERFRLVSTLNKFLMK